MISYDSEAFDDFMFGKAVKMDTQISPLANTTMKDADWTAPAYLKNNPLLKEQQMNQQTYISIDIETINQGLTPTGEHLTIRGKNILLDNINLVVNKRINDLLSRFTTLYGHEIEEQMVWTQDQKPQDTWQCICFDPKMLKQEPPKIVYVEAEVTLNGEKLYRKIEEKS